MPDGQDLFCKNGLKLDHLNCLLCLIVETSNLALIRLGFLRKALICSPIFHKFNPTWTGVVYFDQLLGAGHTQKLVETLFFGLKKRLKTIL